MAYKGKLTTILTGGGEARLIFAETAGLVRRAAEIHRPSKTVTAALGRCLTAASIMGRMMKTEGGSLTLRFSGDGPAGGFICLADWLGNVRGCCDNPQGSWRPTPRASSTWAGRSEEAATYM
jgi:molecular chaperone Hsp33